MNVLFINSCMREGQSRTLKIAQAFLEELKSRNPQMIITEKNLMDINPPYMTRESFGKRNELIGKKEYAHPMFDLAHEFAQADAIVIAAPMWEFSFPAVLRSYIENISVAGITFRYTDHGSEGLCKADRLLFITSRGADFADGPMKACEMGERYLRAVCGMYGIDEVTCLAADGLDEYFTKTDAIVADAVRRAGELAAGWPLPAEVQGE
ncbi:FMN-dependent NADH-azoreductase [Ruminococcus gauvreauii]|uniref:FMN dependent NADH:quinone oxidoreductase n=1 Tax=Ruminococcus gauvreauii TaxID=438033 RepID=A0ABY5VDS3_9FIRM|nr:NAD(P)H-dependent oxidoreductase [Ruminococcus gauvreauii]UWP58452.1 NAD(P)H-dependent oxidoreductase [Ruminococcus gauvreauii]